MSMNDEYAKLIDLLAMPNNPLDHFNQPPFQGKFTFEEIGSSTFLHQVSLNACIKLGNAYIR